MSYANAGLPFLIEACVLRDGLELALTCGVTVKFSVNQIVEI